MAAEDANKNSSSEESSSSSQDKNGGASNIPLTSMSFQQLDQFQTQLAAEIDHCEKTVSGLAGAKGRFDASSESIAELKKHSMCEEQRPILVPLSSSVYIDGYVSKPDELLVDIGTGYYVKKTSDASKKFIDDKISNLNETIKKVLSAAKQKKMLLSQVQSLMQQQYAYALKQKEANDAAVAAGPQVGGIVATGASEALI